MSKSEEPTRAEDLKRGVHTCNGKSCACNCGRGYVDGKAVFARDGMYSVSCKHEPAEQPSTPPSPEEDVEAAVREVYANRPERDLGRNPSSNKKAYSVPPFPAYAEAKNRAQVEEIAEQIERAGMIPSATVKDIVDAYLFAKEQLKACSDLRDSEAEEAAEEIEELKNTNRELNRRVQSLEVELNRQTDRKIWYRYYKAAMSLFERATERAESLELQLSELKAFAKELSAMAQRYEDALIEIRSIAENCTSEDATESADEEMMRVLEVIRLASQPSLFPTHADAPVD